MYTETDRKIDALSKMEKSNFYSELGNVLEILENEDDYGSNPVSIQKIEEAKNTLYRKMFESNKGPN